MLLYPRTETHVSTEQSLWCANCHQTFGNLTVEFVAIKSLIELPNQNEAEQRNHYIQHPTVYRESNSTTLIRIVSDCSFRRGKHPSLSDCLVTGPCLINNLVEIWIGFRIYRVGLVCDFE